MIIMDDVDESLMINWDETSLPAFPANDYTMHVRGDVIVKITGKIKREM